MPNPRIKILFVETYTHTAGGQRGLLDLVHYLDKDSFEPVVLVQGPGKLRDELDKRGIRSVTRRLEPFKNRWLPFSWLIGVGPVMRVLREEKPDVVHSNHLYAGRYSGRAARRMGIPSLVTLRLVHEPEIFDRWNRWETLKFHDRIVANSDEGRLVFESDPEVRRRIVTIKNGMDLGRFRPRPDRAALRAPGGAGRAFGLDERSVVVTQLSSMVPQKGTEDLTRAFLDLCKDDPRLHLFLVGGPFSGTDNTPALRALAREAGCEDRVHFTRFVDDVTEILNLTDISVLCSREREGLPRSLIEAMACGNPVIGTDVGGTRELIEDGVNGFLIPARDPAALRARLSSLIADPERRRSMGEAGLAKARAHHDIRDMIRRYQEIYRELAAGRRT